MTSRIRNALCLLAVMLIAGCATTKMEDRQELVTGKLPRPEHILVYDFAATPDELPANSALAGKHSTEPQTPEQVAEGRKVGAEIAAKLVSEIRAMGMPAERASTATQAQVNDLILRGYLLSVKEGSEGKRLAVGLGSGASELKTAVEGFQMTPQGPRKLGSGVLDAGGSKTPGTAVGLATLIATGNPAGLIVSSGMKIYGEESGRSKIQGRADQTAKEIAEVLKKRFQEQGWI